MDLSYFLIAIVLLVTIDLYVHWRLADRQVNQLKAESARFEGEWRNFLQELKEAVNKKPAA